MPALPADNTFEGGSDETTISTANSGGNSGQAFEVVTIGAGNALVFDDARAAHGRFSSRIDLANNPTTACLYGWTCARQSVAYGFLYVYMTADWTGPSTLRLIGFEQSGSGIGRILITRDTRLVQVTDAAFTHSADSVGALSLNTWMRIGWRITCSATAGEIEARIYTGDSQSPITNGTVTTTAGANTGTYVDRATFGCNAGWTGGVYSFWLDSENLNVDGSYGPPPTVAWLG